jgi:ParB-like chromosome segregation protein Spo0J
LTSEELNTPSKKIGQLYPILVDFYGNIIDGEHRFDVDREWKKMKLKHIKSEKDRIIARIVINNVRRSVSSKEKTILLKRLAEIYLNNGG